MSTPRRRHQPSEGDEMTFYSAKGEPIRERGLPAAGEDDLQVTGPSPAPKAPESPPTASPSPSEPLVATPVPDIQSEGPWQENDDFESFLESLNEEDDDDDLILPADPPLSVQAPAQEIVSEIIETPYVPPHALVSPVIAEQDQEHYPQPKAFIIPKHPSTPTLDEALGFLDDELPSHLDEDKPASVVPIASQPRVEISSPGINSPAPLSSIYEDLLDEDEDDIPSPLGIKNIATPLIIDDEPLPDIGFEDPLALKSETVDSETTPLPDVGFGEAAVEEEEVEEKGPQFHVAVRRGIFSRNSALSVMSSPNLEDDFDELSHVLSAFVGLPAGFRGFVRASLRDAPTFKQESSNWSQSIKMGIDPNAKAESGWKKALDWLHFGTKYLWFQAGKDSKAFGGSAPPLRPGQAAGQAKPIPASQMDEESKQALNDAKKKLQDSVHYDVSLRVGVVGPAAEQTELERIAEEAANGFSAFNTPYQDIVFVPDSDIEAIRGYMAPDQAGQLVLSAAETGVMFKVPDATMRVDGIQVKYSDFKQISPSNPVILHGMSKTYLAAGDDTDVMQLGALLGQTEPEPGLVPLGIINKGSEDARIIGMRVNEMDQHLFYCGRTGSGKSELMKWLIWGSAKAGYPIVLIDPHGALSDDVVNGIIMNCPERVKDIVMCDLSSPDFPVGFNPLDIRNHEQIEGTVGAVLSMLERQMNFAKSSAPRATNYAYLALTALCEANLHLDDPEAKCTLLHVTQFFLDQQFRQLIVSFCENVAVQEMFNPDNGPYERKQPKQQQEEIGPILRAFQELSRSGAFAAVFASPTNKLDFGKLIMQNKIILIKLARFHTQQKLGEFIGSLVLPYLLNSMGEWGRTRDPETGQLVGRGCRCFVDEAPRLLGPDSPVEQILAEARKWDMSLTFASQYLTQFDQAVVQAALANTATKMALVLDPASARLIAEAINSPLVTKNDIAALPRFHYYGNILLPGGNNSGAFSAACMPPLACDLRQNPEAKNERENVIKRSRLIIANNIEEIDRIRKKSIESIRTALTVLHSEKIASGAVGDDEISGNYAVSLDDDDDSIFTS
jgi:hypothetical protein